MDAQWRCESGPSAHHYERVTEFDLTFVRQICDFNLIKRKLQAMLTDELFLFPNGYTGESRCQTSSLRVS